jgi:GNAT superfamily N-acetyltransferase
MGSAAECGVVLEPYSAARHADGPWRVVSEVFTEYGFPFAESDYDADLADPERHYGGRGAGFCVAVQGGEVVGCVGFTDKGKGVYELHRLYVVAPARRGGTGARLVQWVIDAARERGAKRLVLFSDVHFLDAHRLYERMGFRCTRFRYAPDPWQSREWGYELTLREE